MIPGDGRTILDRKIPGFQYLKANSSKRLIDRVGVVDHEQTASQLDIGLDPEMVGIVGVEAIGQAVLVTAEAPARF